MHEERSGPTDLWKMFNIRACFQYNDGNWSIFNKTTCNCQTPWLSVNQKVNQKRKANIRVTATDDDEIISRSFFHVSEKASGGIC